MKIQNNYIKLIIILLVLLLFSDCGISDVPLFEKATVYVSSAGLIVVNHNISNTSSSFIGYHVFYKLYQNTDTTIRQSDASYLTDSARAPSISNITGKGFRQLISVEFNGTTFSEVEKKPLLQPEDKGTSKSYYFYFNHPAQAYIGEGDIKGYQAILKEDTNVELLSTTDYTILHRRLNAAAHKTFFYPAADGATAYSSTDDDIVSMINTSDNTFISGEKLDIALAVIPYGIDLQKVQRVYGDIVVSSPTPIEYDYKTDPK